MNDQLNPKVEALMQLLGAEAAEKAIGQILTSLTPEQRMEVAMEFARRAAAPAIEKNAYGNDFGNELHVLFKEALTLRREELRAMMLAKVDVLKSKWVDVVMEKSMGRGW